MNGGEGGGAKDGLDVFTLEQVSHPPLHGLIAQSADPKGQGAKAPIAKGREDGFHQVGVTGLEQGPIGDHPDPRTALVAPVVGKRITQGDHPGWFWGFPFKQGSKAAQGTGEVVRTALSEALRQRQGEGQRQGAESGEGKVLTGRTGKHQQMPSWIPRDPMLQLLEAITPMAPAAKQPHHNKARWGDRGADVVVNNRRVAQGRQIQAPQGLAQELWLGVQEPIDRD